MAAHAALRSASVGGLSIRCQHEELAFFSPLQAYNCQPEAPFWHLLQPTIHRVGPLSTPSSPCRASPPSAPRGRTVPMAASDRLTGSRDTISRAPRRLRPCPSRAGSTRGLAKPPRFICETNARNAELRSASADGRSQTPRNGVYGGPPWELSRCGLQQNQLRQWDKLGRSKRHSTVKS